MAAAIPTAFTTSPLLFAGAYVVLQVGRNAASRWLLEDDHALRVVFERILAWSLLSAVFWIAGALAPHTWRFAVWGVAVLIDFAAPVVGYRTPSRGRSATTDYPVDGGHFAERFQSFIIIVLGESIVVTGATASERALSPSSALALAVAFLITGGLWWLYFGVVAENSRQHIANAQDPAVLARDAYTYLHLPSSRESSWSPSATTSSSDTPRRASATRPSSCWSGDPPCSWPARTRSASG